MNELNPACAPETLSYLLSPRAIRERAARLYDLALRGETHFEVHVDRLEEVAEYVRDVTLEEYPGLELPVHSRWGHFQVGGVDRLGILEERLGGLSASERAKAKLDLVVVSVLLDAGAGPGWSYREPGADPSTPPLARSEGLAVASFHMFLDGLFSSSAGHPCRVDAAGLRDLDAEALRRGFQVTDDNPLVGLLGRLQLLGALGEALEAEPTRFGVECPRPGGLWDGLTDSGRGDDVDAVGLLSEVLHGFGQIWPGRLSLEGVSLGDCWRHPLLGEPGDTDALIPFHKLSQWLTYSMIEPIEESGHPVTGVERLTGLAEYRNGGLFVDMGVLSLRDPGLLAVPHRPGDLVIIEWRALTLHLLELLAPRVRGLLGKSEEEFPLAKVLEGGTWRAGRKIARSLRSNGAPPLELVSDGTVF